VHGYKVLHLKLKTHNVGGGATRPLPRDGGVNELHGDPQSDHASHVRHFIMTLFVNKVLQLTVDALYVNVINQPHITRTISMYFKF